MSTVRPMAPGSTRTCPHCRSTILESAAVCPACRHHLRFEPGADKRAESTITPLKVEGTIHHPATSEPWEYSVVVAIRNERGEQVARQVIGVGALKPGDRRTFSLEVEVFPGSKSKR